MDIYKILSELDERVGSKMQLIVKNFEDNKGLTHLELSNMFFDFQYNQKHNIISGILFDILSEQGIDFNDLKTEEDKRNASVVYQIMPEKIEKIIDTIYRSKISLIVFNGTNRTF